MKVALKVKVKKPQSVTLGERKIILAGDKVFYTDMVPGKNNVPNKYMVPA